MNNEPTNGQHKDVQNDAQIDVRSKPQHAQRVLIVEDDVELGNLFAEILQELGHETLVVGDGALAYELIMGSKPAMVILDMHLPGLSGLEILDRIRANRSLEGTKVVIVTADALMASRAGHMADLALLKPVTLAQLVSLSARLLQ